MVKDLKVLDLLFPLHVSFMFQSSAIKDLFFFFSVVLIYRNIVYSLCSVAEKFLILRYFALAII